MSGDQTARRAAFFDQAAKNERLSPPAAAQVGRAVRHPPGGGADIRIFEVQSAGGGDGLYDCYEQKLLASAWDDTDGDDKFTEKDETPEAVVVLNLIENDPVSDYVPALGKYDRISAWQMADSGNTQRWVGRPLTSPVRRFKTTESATANDHITCDMVLNNGVEAAEGELGYHVEVYCDIYNGTALNTAATRLQSGKYLYAELIDGKWRCVALFDTDTEECDCYEAP